MSDPLVLEHLSRSPNVSGCVHCADTGEVVLQTGDDVTELAFALGEFVEMAAQIGESFGLDALHEAQIHCKTRTAVCMPYRGGAIGVMLGSRAGAAEVAANMQDLFDKHGA